MSIRLSVIVPVYNTENYLEACVRSIVTQAPYLRGEVELVLVDDGSPDNCGPLCDALAEQYDRLVVCHRENGGLSAARNTGIEAATGEYLQFVDSDDTITDGSLERLFAALDTQPDVVLLSFVEQNAADGKRYEPTYHLGKQTVETLTGENLLSYLVTDRMYNWYCWLTVVKRDFVLSHHLYFEEGRNFEDALWTPQVLYMAEKVTYIDEPTYVYIINRVGSITRVPSEKNYNDKQNALRFMKSFCREHRFSERTAAKLMGNVSQIYVSLLADIWLLPTQMRSQKFAELREYTVCLQHATQRYKRLLYKALPFIGLRGVSWVLHLRAQYVRHRYRT